MKVLKLDATSGVQDLSGRPIATIGNFDGLHRGHRALLASLIHDAREAHEPALVITFEPHPVLVLHPGAALCNLRTLEQRLRGFEETGIDVVALLRFDAALAAMTPGEFSSAILARALQVSEVRVGPRFRFGRGRAGDFAALQQLGVELGFRTRAQQPVLSGPEPVSSTRIRAALTEGAVEVAAELLGEPFEVEGTVVRGQGRGRALGFATANLAPKSQCLPAPGVYATTAVIAGVEWRGASFLGTASTFGDRDRVFETHLPGWPGTDLYGEHVRVRFLRRVRGPITFPSPAELAAQIARDVAEALRD